MEKKADEDITTDVCPSCSGVFLDFGELNILATGMQGNIEYCSIDENFHKDRFPGRACPRCVDRPMKKVNLLRVADIVFDYCPECGGFFLDAGEIQKMNRELKSFTSNKKAEEYREIYKDHLVRIDQTSDVIHLDYAGVSRLVDASYVRISVFFNRDMPIGIHVFREEWFMRLAKSLRLFRGQDIKTGDSKFDSTFRVQGEDEATVAAHLDSAAREALISFTENEQSISGKSGNLDVTPTGLLYVEGPYKPNSINVVNKAMPLVDKLIEIADKIETVPEKPAK